MPTVQVIASQSSIKPDHNRDNTFMNQSEAQLLADINPQDNSRSRYARASEDEFIDEWNFADASPDKNEKDHGTIQVVDLKDLKPGFKLDLFMEQRMSAQEGFK